MDREQIVKALECHTKRRCYDCPLAKEDIEQLNKPCSTMIAELALALIRELIEEKERLIGVGLPDYSTYIRLSDAKTAIMAYIGEQTVSKYASQAECKAARSGAEGAMNELDYITPAQVAPKADTVRKMHDMLENRIKGNLAYHGWYLKETVIPKIAKEMLEDGAPADDFAKADTLSDLQTRFAMHFGTYTKDATIKVGDVFKLLERFKEEIMEG